MDENFILETRNLTVKFGGLTAVNNVSIQVPKGKIVGIIGPNGAGKTTLLNLITSSTTSTSGEIILEGKQLKNTTIIQVAHMGVSRTFQNIRLCSRMTAIENIITSIQRDPEYSVFAAMLGLPKTKRNDKKCREEALEYLKMFSIEKYANKPAGSLPYGQQRRLEIARAIATKPRLLMLDEPAAGMNTEECSELAGLIKDIREKLGLTIMIVEHHIEVIRKLSDYVYVINLGSVLKHGTPQEVLTDPEVIKAYLGEKRGLRNVNA